MNPQRVEFFSVHDGAWYRNMLLAETVLESFSVENKYDVNDIIELYQIKLYLDKDIFLPKWTEKNKEEIKQKIKEVWSIVVQFWNQINSENLISIFNQLECWTLQDRFWEISVNLFAYKRFDKEVFACLLKQDNCNLRAILHQERLVKYFDVIIKDRLLNTKMAAELLLSQYVENHNTERVDSHFPKSLTLEDRESIVSTYLENEDANINFVRLALNVKNSDKLKISPKVRLKAKTLEGRLNNEIFNEDVGISFGVQVGFSKEQKEPLVVTKEGNIKSYLYGIPYVFQYNDPVFYLSHFDSLFNYLDNQNCISLVSKHYEFDSLENFLVRSRNEYRIGPAFYQKKFRSYSQIFLYDHILSKNEKGNIENLIQYYIVEHLNRSYQLSGFRFNLPSLGTNYTERIRTLLAEYDAFLRQYKLYVEDGEIDVELLNMSTEPYSFSQIPSFVKKKYCYLNNDKLTRSLYLLFSDQSSLNYIEAFKDSRFRNFYDLISNKSVLYEHIEDYQKDSITYLFENDFLVIDDDGFICAKDENQLFLLRQLYFEEVINYWHYTQDCRDILDKMDDEGIVFFEDALFCKSERSYFNYYLNDKEFTNGPKIRNHFAHGTNSYSENELIKSYYYLLILIVLTLLKIDDDLSIWKKNS